MFTGIIQHVGRVVRASASPRAIGAGTAHTLAIDIGPLAEALPLGASIAVNGACLTAAALERTVARFDVVPETWRRTTLGELRVGDAVNLERSLRVGDALDGHFVQGHVDALGRVERVDRTGGEWKLWIRCDAEPLRDMVPKGSIAIDGVSLTLVDVEDARFSVALVPTTLERTVLGKRQPGQRVNLETDILARIVRRQLSLMGGAASPSGVTWGLLAEHGLAP
jgi:riboflavin synthase